MPSISTPIIIFPPSTIVAQDKVILHAFRPGLCVGFSKTTFSDLPLSRLAVNHETYPVLTPYAFSPSRPRFLYPTHHSFLLPVSIALPSASFSPLSFAFCKLLISFNYCTSNPLTLNVKIYFSLLYLRYYEICIPVVYNTYK